MNLKRADKPQGNSNQSRQVSAFTLVELLVIVGMVGILALMVTPVIANTKPNSKALRCQNNLRQFNVAWSMYSADYGDRVPNNFGVAETQMTIQTGRFETWANNVMTWGVGPGIADSSKTNRSWIGLLGKYVASADNIYHCPSDTYLSSAQAAAGFSHRMRSISMNSAFGRFSTGADSTAGGFNWGFPQYVQYLKQTRVPKPSKTWLVIEEHPDSINDGLFINSPTANNWQDIPAVFHNGGTSLSFADGHTEVKHWRNTPITTMRVVYAYPTLPAFNSAGKADYAWYLSRTGWIEASTGRALFGY